MTDFATMLAFFSPETEYSDSECPICGTTVHGVQKNNRGRTYCEDCKRERRDELQTRARINRGGIKSKFYDPEVDLVYAVITHALEDRDWQRQHPRDGETLNLADCGAREFIDDGGVELWLAALGVGVRPSMAEQIRRTG